MSGIREVAGILGLGAFGALSALVLTNVVTRVLEGMLERQTRRARIEMLRKELQMFREGAQPEEKTEVLCRLVMEYSMEENELERGREIIRQLKERSLSDVTREVLNRSGDVVEERLEVASR